MKILVTGAAGFIGSHLVQQLVQRGDEVVGLDSMNTYYDVTLKHRRLQISGIDVRGMIPNRMVQSTLFANYRFVQMQLEDRTAIQTLFAEEKFDKVCHLAAQAGVRYSIENPYAYIDSNINGFIHILEGCRHYPVTHLVYASSSSVYGMNSKVPFSEDDRVDEPVSLYAATKKSNELMVHTYRYLYHIPITGLRFFTVYGPWGRPDMAPMLFADAILHHKPIKVFNNGNLSRDFTYISDIVEGVMKVIDRPPSQDAQAGIYNIGCGHPVALMDFIHTLEQALGQKACLEMYPMQPGDVYQTYADTTRLERDFGYKPQVRIEEGISKMVEWVKDYFDA